MARPRRRRPAPPPPPPDDDDPFADSEAVGQANVLLDKVDNLFSRAAAGIDRMTGWWNQAQEMRQQVQQRQQARRPPQPGPQPRQAPPQPPPPPKDNREEIFRQALIIFGWRPGVAFTKAQVKERRKVLLSSFHPDDKGGLGDDTMFKRINAAAKVLDLRAS